MTIQDIDDPVDPNVTYFLVYNEDGGATIYAENSETGEVYCTKDWGASWEEVWYDDDQTDRWKV